MNKEWSSAYTDPPSTLRTFGPVRAPTISDILRSLTPNEVRLLLAAVRGAASRELRRSGLVHARAGAQLHMVADAIARHGDVERYEPEDLG